jgi:hypothetical protein
MKVSSRLGRGSDVCVFSLMVMFRPKVSIKAQARVRSASFQALHRSIYIS